VFYLTSGEGERQPFFRDSLHLRVSHHPYEPGGYGFQNSEGFPSAELLIVSDRILVHPCQYAHPSPIDTIYVSGSSEASELQQGCQFDGIFPYGQPHVAISSVQDFGKTISGSV